MNKFKQLSMVGVVSSGLVVKYAWLGHTDSAWAASRELREENEIMQPRSIERRVLPAVIDLILNGEPNFNLVPGAQTTQEDTNLDFIAANNNLISIEGANIVSTTLAVSQGVLTVNTSGGAMLAGSNGQATITLTGTLAQINAALATLNYSPSTDFNGTDALSVLTSDVNGASDTDTIQVIVTPSDDGSPSAVNDEFQTPINTAITGNVLSNDTIIDEADIDPVNNAATDQLGSISIAADGELTYTPANNFTDADSFVYTLRDSDDETSFATVLIQVGVPEVIIADNNGSAFGSETVVENETITAGTLTLSAPTGLASSNDPAVSIASDGSNLDLTLNQLNDLANASLTITGVNGLLELTSFNSVTGALTYNYDPSGSFRDHSNGDLSVTDSFTITAIDGDSFTSTPTELGILIADTSPEANNDANSLSEGSSAKAGNLVGLAGMSVDDKEDTIIDTNATPVVDIDFGTTDGTPGSNLASAYGTFVVSNAGVYTYTLDNNNTMVQGLKSGETLEEVFTYTIEDGDGDQDTGTLSVTINGVDDAAPTVNVADADGGTSSADNSVFEATTEIISGGASVSATAGVDQLLVNGINAIDASQTPVTIIGDHGTLKVTGFSGGNSLSYTYQGNNVAESHLPDDDSVQDSFTIQVVDNEGDAGSDILDILIVDTQPSSVADNQTVVEDSNAYSFSVNVLSNDNGADKPFSIVNAAFNSTSATLGTAFDTDYGSMTITSDGDFLYTLDNDDASVQALRANQNLTETITYTIEDADEDQVMASQTITIQGVDEPPVLSIPNEGTAPAGADLPVVENATVQGSFGINAESGLKTSGTALQLVDEAGDILQLSFSALQALASVNQTLVGADGTLRLNGYSSSLDTTTINYVFDPTGTRRDHSAGDLSVIQQFTITAIDEQDISTPTRVLDILITDTAPTAALDTNSITEGFSVNVVVGDVTTNDTQGSDTSISVVGIDFNGSKTVGTPFASDYGTLDLNSDGTYTYTLDNGNAAVNNLNNGQSLEEMFTYTIEDTDGDDSSSTLIVTINGGIDDD